jgi:hypothetical protein
MLPFFPVPYSPHPISTGTKGWFWADGRGWLSVCQPGETWKAENDLVLAGWLDLVLVWSGLVWSDFSFQR